MSYYNKGTPNQDKQKLRKIALDMNTNDPKKYDDYCEKIDGYVSSSLKNLTSTQLRNIFNKVIKAEKVIDLKKIRPLLAYTAARNDIKDFADLMDNIIKSINKDEEVKSFKEFMKVLVAYKKYGER